MNKVATISLLSAGGLLVFSAAYIGFAKMNGAPLHELPVFGSLFPKPEAHADDAAASAETQDEHASSQEPTHDAEATEPETIEPPTNPALEQLVQRQQQQQADLLGMFKLDSPFSADELRELVASLKHKNREADRRLAEIVTKEELISDRLETLEERQRALESLKGELEALRRELDARAEELDRDSSARKDEDAKAVEVLGNLFADGEVEELAKRLQNYGPTEASKILVTLEPDRAKELLDALPQAKWRDFAEAYTRLAAARKSLK